MGLAACRSVRRRRPRDALLRLAHWLGRACRGRGCVLYINRKTIRTRMSPRVVAAAALATVTVVIIGFETISIRAAALLDDWGQLSRTATTTPRLATALGFGRSGLI